MNLPTQPYKGARDFYPEDKRLQKYIFGLWRTIAERWGYEEYDGPLIESLDLYKAKTGEEIVNEQTYQFTDRGGREVAIRPEMTPTLARMVAGRRQELAYPLRWYSIPGVWRYERPQKGRLREHWQLNMDVVGLDDLNAELEIIRIADEIMRAFGARPNQYVIKLNSRKLLNWLLGEHLGLSDTELKNSLKILDKKTKMSEEEFKQNMQDAAGAKSQKLTSLLEFKNLADLPGGAPSQSLSELLSMLKRGGINADWDMTIARGFDYYTDIVFEIFDTDPANNRSILGGGRYAGLVGLFGVEPISGVGFGLGEVTLKDFLITHQLLPALKSETDVFAVLIGPVEPATVSVLKELRQSGVNVAAGAHGQKADKQIKTAIKKGIAHALFIGEEELKTQKFTLKNLKSAKEAKHSLAEIAKILADYRAS